MQIGISALLKKMLENVELRRVTGGVRDRRETRVVTGVQTTAPLKEKIDNFLEFVDKRSGRGAAAAIPSDFLGPGYRVDSHVDQGALDNTVLK